MNMIITEENAFEAAELIVRSYGTREQVEAAAAVLVQSPDWKQRILGRETRAGLYAQRGAELQTEIAKAAAKLEAFPDFLPDFTTDLSTWKRDLALVAGFVLGFCAVVRWWPL
ncbi:MAG: hypothetical protein Q8K33_01715 [Cypionkella sp.]|uniref:hypothetical protein n=1 Tax=Cypionkella sp. TaxID=2811411 RepID=UPI0027313F06|nr:hypothetical protein [Cypionkella sp.]MDP2047599.1 hypothetical protein [Cypionkella sp.]